MLKPDGVLTLTPPQWIQCDLRYLDMTFLGMFINKIRFTLHNIKITTEVLQPLERPW